MRPLPAALTEFARETTFRVVRYGDALKSLADSRDSALRTAKFERLDRHLRAWAEALGPMMHELLDVDRRKVRWAAEKGKQMSHARIADKLFGRTSVREKHLRRLASGGAAPRSLNRRDEDAVREFVAAERRQAEGLRPRDGRTRFVAFGDGCFRPGYRGHCAVPRKPLLAMLMERGPVVLVDEYGSSMNCTCGRKLRDLPKAAKSKNGAPHDRPRICESVDLGQPCPLFDDAQHQEEGLDRDELSCLSLIDRVHVKITTGEMPHHAKRPARARSREG